MNIKKYKQGINDRDIFCKVGSWLTNKDVHDELGMAITSQKDDNWYISSLNNITTGFALTRATKSTNAIHIRFIYSDVDTKKRFIKTILDEVKENNITSVWTNDRKSEKIWKELGFSFTKRARGEFGRWQKELKKAKETNNEL
jgi:hypothetical protein